jgi:hypothetical protein
MKSHGGEDLVHAAIFLLPIKLRCRAFGDLRAQF